MVEITEIKKTRKGRYALFCDNGFLFSIDEETMYLSGVKEGSALSSAELDELCEKSDLNAAKEKAMLYLSMREHSKAELLQKLKLRFDEHSALCAVEKAESLGLINDERFAQAKTRALAVKNKSSREIKRQLLLKGIDRESADKILEDAEISDLQACRAVIQKHYAAKLAVGKRDAVFAALARRGFSFSVIKQAVAEHSDEQDEYYFDE